MHSDIKQKDNIEKSRFRISTPDGYKPNAVEMSNALYLFGNFGFETIDTDWLLDKFSEDIDVIEYLESCRVRLEEKHGPPKERVFEMLNTWFKHTSQEDRTHVWTRPK